MNDETTASKVSRLLQKSRQAFRIYSSMSKSAKAEHNEYADMQAVEWRNINAELVRQLTHIIEKYSAKNLALQVARMRDLLLSDYRRVEAELNSEHREIISCTQRGDFIQVAQLARVLISKKAFVQAAQAASHELSLIIDDHGTALNNRSAFNNNPLHHNPQQQGLIAQELEFQRDFSGASTSITTPATSSTKSLSHQESILENDVEIPPRMAKVIPLRR